MSKKDYHIIPHQGRWAVKQEGASRASSLHDTQSAAAAAGRELAKSHHTEVVIHRPDGRIRDSDSYGGDPIPSHDKKH